MLPLKIKLSSQSYSDMFDNKISAILRIVGIATYIGGFILGISTLNGSEFSWSIAIFIWSYAFISGTMFLGFSEIINLLDVAAYKSYESEDISKQLSVIIKEALASETSLLYMKENNQK